MFAPCVKSDVGIRTRRGARKQPASRSYQGNQLTVTTEPAFVVKRKHARVFFFFLFSFFLQAMNNKLYLPEGLRSLHRLLSLRNAQQRALDTGCFPHSNPFSFVTTAVQSGHMCHMSLIPLRSQFLEFSPNSLFVHQSL